MTGKVRDLVPFFLATPEGDVVNDPNNPHPHAHPVPLPAARTPPASPPLVTLHIRHWDASEGFFHPKVHHIHDTHPGPLPVAPRPASPTPSPPSATPRLLTPQQIRRARRSAAVPSPGATSGAPAPAVARVEASPPRGRVSVEEGGKTRFAGSTFEAASPSPAGLPIPAFVRRGSARTDGGEGDSAAREKAAVDLRRILRI